MCGIWGYIQFLSKYEIDEIFKSFMTVQKRGPDRSDFKIINEFVKIYLGFHRLAIMDKSTNGDQPFTLEIKNDECHKSIYAICNGEIYNFKEHVQKNNFILKSQSDCEFIPQMYAEYGFQNMLEQLRGEFAICVIDIDHNNSIIQVFIGRDQTAVRPLFFGADANGIGFSSTLSGLIKIIAPENIRQINGGEILRVDLKQQIPAIITSIKYHEFNKQYIPESKIEHEELYYQKIRNSLIDGVTCRLVSDRPLGALLSGGLDSSLVVSIAATHLKKYNKRLRTFSIGIAGSTDRPFAELVSKHCDTDHTHVEFTQVEFLNAIEKVIIAIETYDITTVRASVGQYLLAKWIKDNTDIKVLLIGDGSDELTAGYMYFHNAPSPLALHEENIRLIQEIMYFDVLRADRCIAINGIEARVPFLDHHFVELYLSIDPKFRMPIYDDNEKRKVEKWLLRKSFDIICPETNIAWLPHEVLWRKKEAFSDGVSSCEKSWYQIIQEHVENVYSDQDFNDPDVKYHMMAPTKEALYYRKIFNINFHPRAAAVIPHYWFPLWSGNVKDPSARVLEVYQQ